MWAIATCFALLVLAFSLLRNARPGVASAGQQPPTLVISGGAQPTVLAEEPMIAPLPSEPTLAPEGNDDARRKQDARKRKKKRVVGAGAEGTSEF